VFRCRRSKPQEQFLNLPTTFTAVPAAAGQDFVLHGYRRCSWEMGSLCYLDLMTTMVCLCVVWTCPQTHILLFFFSFSFFTSLLIFDITFTFLRGPFCLDFDIGSEVGGAGWLSVLGNNGDPFYIFSCVWTLGVN